MIVNIGSFFERLGAKQSTAHCASKAAVGAITRCLAAEWGRYGVSAVNVAPGYIETDINTDYLSSPEGRAQVSARSFLNRPGRGDEIAGLVGTLVSGKVPFLTGETVFVDGSHGISL
ncbi:SDR family oxidoreductase [Mameliella sp. AT18]|nr:SDR family oxidoreductase [Mameliella sp. AT18]MDD9731393.1 SDR family oxidoreductase [Mameliella sp. AT18]